MEKYKNLIQKKINLEFNGIAINSYKLTEILPTLENMEGRGRLYKCKVDWEKKIAGTYPVLNFDSKTLNELIEHNLSICPDMPNLIYRVDEKK